MIGEQLKSLRHRIEKAQSLCRDGGGCTLIGVCKRQAPEKVLQACELGVLDLGENTVQGLEQTDAFLRERGVRPRWHFVGRLQRNKVKRLLGFSPLIHSLDRLSLAEEISKRATKRTDVLIQVNIGEEAQKGGVAPTDTLEFAQALGKWDGLRLRGLMAIPPAGQPSGPYFEKLRILSQKLRATDFGHGATELSMGMSNDFEAAIEMGSTMIRVGTSLFGEREQAMKLS